MKNSSQLLLLAGAAILLLAGCGKLRARDQLNKGVQSYKNARYEEAIGHFQSAVALDPALLNARLYLATAYAQQYVPGVESEENTRLAQQAIEQFKSVLAAHPGRDQRFSSLKGIASLYFNMHMLDDAKAYQQKVIEADPNDPEAYYSVGVIEWTQAYQSDAEERAKLGLKGEDILEDKQVCAALRLRNERLIEGGLTTLRKALAIRPDYDDAMAYVNLLYRQKADIECNVAASREDLRIAQEWVDRNLAAKRSKEKQQAAAGITLEKASE